MIQIDGYEILNPLGAGGVGEVYLANQLATGSKVALKVLLPQHADNPDLRKQFLREGRIAAGLNHPHIVRIHEVGESAAVPYVTMEYLPAGDLKSMLSSRADLFMVLNAIHQIAGALVYTHGLGIVHGDVKPQNILFRDSGHAVLSDFGVAREKQEIFSNEKASHVMGSPIYISPEQVRGEQPSHLSDIYSLGVILFEALSGHPPFLGESPIETARLRLMAAETPKLAEEFTDYQTFIDQMMTRDPKKRCLELSDFINDFHSVMQGNTAQEIEETQRLSMDDYIQNDDSDFFFIAPRNLSEAQESTQPMQVLCLDSTETDIQIAAHEEVLSADETVDVVTDRNMPTAVDYSSQTDEPLGEWVSNPSNHTVLDSRDGKLNDLFFFLHEIKEGLKETVRVHRPNYPQAEDISLFLRPARKQIKRQSIIFSEKLSGQTKIWFAAGLVLLGSGILGVVFSNEDGQVTQKIPAVLEPSQPGLAATHVTGSLAEPSSMLSSLSLTEDVPIGVEDATKTVPAIASGSDNETENPVLFNQAAAEDTALQNEASPGQANNQPAEIKKALVADAANRSTSIVLASSEATEIAMLETSAPQAIVSQTASTGSQASEMPVTSDLDSGVMTSGGRTVINRELEAALGRHVGWMIRRQDGSLSLFVDWVDLMNEARDDFSEDAKNSLNVLGYIMRNYGGFTVSITDHSHQQKTISVARARKVLNYLREQGVPRERVRTLALLTGNMGNVEMRLVPTN